MIAINVMNSDLPNRFFSGQSCVKAWLQFLIPARSNDTIFRRIGWLSENVFNEVKSRTFYNLETKKTCIRRTLTKTCIYLFPESPVDT